ncbi:MAG: hypothetical protein L3J39_03870 [Verrucomicrobiales bacterium]|nr:hypothetical protein [Verrucomicrobiales bacterium]
MMNAKWILLIVIASILSGCMKDRVNENRANGVLSYATGRTFFRGHTYEFPHIITKDGEVECKYSFIADGLSGQRNPYAFYLINSPQMSKKLEGKVFVKVAITQNDGSLMASGRAKLSDFIAGERRSRRKGQYQDYYETNYYLAFRGHVMPAGAKDIGILHFESGREYYLSVSLFVDAEGLSNEQIKSIVLVPTLEAGRK